MYALLYIVIMFFVTGLLIWLPVFPFWKVWKRLKTHHPDLWAAKGPFDIRTMTAHPETFSGFLEIINLAEKDETLVKKDPELVKWARGAREILKMAPNGFMGQVGYFIVFLWFVLLFSSLLMDVFT